MRHFAFRAFVLFIAPLAVAMDHAEPTLADEAAASSSSSIATPSERLFALKVLPTLQSKCFACHGDDEAELKGELNLKSRDAMIHGGESGEATLVPGQPGEGLLLGAVRWEDLEMPPKENDRLTVDQIAALEQWIAAGAPWPSVEKQQEILRGEREVAVNDEGMLIATSGGLADEWTYRRYQPTDVWAFQPLASKSELLPKESNAHPVDEFVDQKLAESGLSPAAEADAKTLIRRATYDLIGLPPTVEEVKAFLIDWESNREQAWSNLIDRLLASPHYGERWGQHWLDIVRYADTSGFSNDYERSNAWRYRDYVIRSFNEDKPYHEFIVQQLAGDELETDDADDVIATGYLRMGPWGTAMIPTAEARQIYLDDLVNSVGQTFVSLPLRCCKCHDHKFDPIPTRDYYRVYAALSATQPAEVEVPFSDAENRDGMDAGKALVESLRNHAKEERDRLANKREAAARQWYAEQGKPYKSLKDRNDDPDHLKPPRHVGLTTAEQGLLKVREQDVWIWGRRLERYQPLAQSVFNGADYNYNARKLRQPKKQKSDWRPESFILAGGALGANLDAVLPGVLSALQVPLSGADTSRSGDPYVLPEQLDGRRLELAQWIASPENPLTARSIVNRVWQHHFGFGLVRTANNFGVKGDKPTHPELLDWLAADFIENGWTLKRMHRLIMTSAAYRRSTQHENLDQLAAVDPDNKLLARFTPRRLTAEEIRDSMLAASGELNRELGGLPVMPEINWDVALQPRMIQFSLAPAYQASPTPEQRNRRSIYAYRVRGQANPFLEIFNQPNPNESCQLRNSAAVTPQAFTLINSEAATDRSIGLALRAQSEADDVEGQIRRAFQLALAREPNADEINRLEAYFVEMRNYHTDNEPKSVPYPTKVKRSLVEELSGEPFEYYEWLPVYENYTPDAKPWTVDASTRALADVCLLLFNSNEFVYVY